jgi:hypothetical protein
MMKRLLFAVLIFAAPIRLVSAQDAKVSVDLMGIGGMSCAHWRSTQEHLQIAFRQCKPVQAEWGGATGLA